MELWHLIPLVTFTSGLIISWLIFKPHKVETDKPRLTLQITRHLDGNNKIYYRGIIRNYSKYKINHWNTILVTSIEDRYYDMDKLLKTLGWIEFEKVFKPSEKDGVSDAWKT